MCSPVSGSPVAEHALIILAPAQDPVGIFHLLIDLGPAQAEVRFIGQKKTAEGAARDLLAAAVRETLQVEIKTVGQAKGHG